MNALRKNPAENTPLPAPANIVPLPSASGSTIKRVNFGGLAAKSAPTTRSAFPVLPDDDQHTVAQLAAQFLAADEALTQAESDKDLARAELIRLSTPFHFQQNCGKGQLVNTVAALTDPDANGLRREALIQFKNAYKNIDDLKDDKGNILQPVEERIKAIPAQVFEQYFRQTFTLKVDSRKIPDDKLQSVVDRLQEVAAEFGITDAISIASGFKPVEAWHSDRYRVLSPEQNEQLEQSMGEKGFMTIAVGKARGRKSK
jgi:hypothetical protein